MSFCTSTSNPSLSYIRNCVPLCNTITATTICTGETDPALFPPRCSIECDGQDLSTCPQFTMRCQSVPPDCHIEVAEGECSWFCDPPLHGYSCEAPACAVEGNETLATHFVASFSAMVSSEEALRKLLIGFTVVLGLLVIVMYLQRVRETSNKE